MPSSSLAMARTTPLIAAGLGTDASAPSAVRTIRPAAPLIHTLPAASSASACTREF
jgi:hypothetical protein